MEKLAHAANVLVSAGALAISDGLIPGAGSTISGYLSLREVTKAQSPEMKSLGKALERDLQAISEGVQSSDPKVHLADMILLADLSADDLISEKLDAENATKLMLRKIAKAAPRSNYVTHAFQSCFRFYIGQLLTKILQNTDFVETLQPQFMQAVLKLASKQQQALDRI